MPPINQKQAVPLTTDAPYKIGIYWVKSRGGMADRLYLL